MIRLIGMLWGCDYGNVFYLFELVMDCVVRDAFYSKAPNVMMSNHMFLLFAHENVYDSEFHYCVSMNNDGLIYGHKLFLIAFFYRYAEMDYKHFFDYFRETDNVNENANVNGSEKANGFHLNSHPHQSGYFDMQLWLIFWALTAVYGVRMQYIFAL